MPTKKKREKVRLVNVTVKAPAGRDFDKLLVLGRAVDALRKALDAIDRLSMGTVVEFNGDMRVGNNLTIEGNTKADFGESCITIESVEDSKTAGPKG